jgi:hypothetical protein
MLSMIGHPSGAEPLMVDVRQTKRHRDLITVSEECFA